MKLAAFLSFLLASCTLQPTEEWTSISIDRQQSSEFRLVTRGDEFIGGHDSCNEWGRSDQEGLISIDLQGCLPDPLRDTYWTLVAGDRATVTREGARLLVTNNGHSGSFVKIP